MLHSRAISYSEAWCTKSEAFRILLNTRKTLDYNGAELMPNS